MRRRHFIAATSAAITASILKVTSNGTSSLPETEESYCADPEQQALAELKTVIMECVKNCSFSDALALSGLPKDVAGMGTDELVKIVRKVSPGVQNGIIGIADLFADRPNLSKPATEEFRRCLESYGKLNYRYIMSKCMSDEECDDDERLRRAANLFLQRWDEASPLPAHIKERLLQRQKANDDIAIIL